MKRAEFLIRGIRPTLFNKFNIETLTDTKKPLRGTTGNDSESWKDGVWAEGTKLFLPNFVLHAAFCEGAKKVKKGRGSISKDLSGALSLPDEKYYFNRELPKPLSNITDDDLSRDSSREIYIDVRAVNNPMTKGKNIRYRLALKAGWELRITCEWNDSIVSTSSMKSCVECTGELVGISDARGIGFGRYELLEFNLD